MKSLAKLLLSLLFIFTVFQSCEKDQGPLVIKPPRASGDTVISFANDIQPIFDQYCVECHNQSHPFLDLRPYYSYNELLHTGNRAPYVDIVDPSLSYIVGRLSGTILPRMPPDPPLVSQGNIDTLMIWIRQGAKDN